MSNIELFTAEGPTQVAYIASEPGQHLACVIKEKGTYYERKLLDVIRVYNRPGVYVDVGANIGNHSVYFALECPSTEVIAIEPFPQTFQELEATIAANGLESKVHVLQMAVHPTLEEVAAVEPDQVAGGHPNRGMVFVRPGAGVPADTLDNILQGYSDIAVIKVDVEGLGVEVIESGLRCIKQNLPLISCEADGQDAQRLDDLLAPLGYGRKQKNLAATPTYLWIPSPNQ